MTLVLRVAELQYIFAQQVLQDSTSVSLQAVILVKEKGPLCFLKQKINIFHAKNVNRMSSNKVDNES